MDTSKSISSLYEEALQKLDIELAAKKLILGKKNEKDSLVLENLELIAKRNIKLIMLEDLKLEKENPDKAYLRHLRREKEVQCNKFVSPGPWDDDLDTYQFEECRVHLNSELNEAGYKARLVRNKETHSWDILIKVPEDHWIVKDYYHINKVFDRIQKDDFLWKMSSYHMIEYEIGFDNKSTTKNYIGMYESMQIAFKIVDRLKKHDNL